MTGRRTRRPCLGAVVTAACAMLMAGCSTDADPAEVKAPTPTSSPKPSSSATATETPTTIPTAIRTPWPEPAGTLSPGDGLEVLRILPSYKEAELDLRYILDDGRLLIAQYGELRLEDAVTGASTPINVPDTNDPGGIFSADDDGRYLTWVTTAMSDLFHFPWRIHTMDLTTGQVRQVARHHNVGVKPIPVAPNGTQPVIHKGQVYYSAVHRLTKKGAVIPAVYSAPADGSRKPKIEVDNAYGPLFLGNELVYTTSRFGFLDWTLHARNLTTGTERTIDTGPSKRHRLGALASNEETLVYQTREPRSSCALHILTAAGQTQQLGPDSCGRHWGGPNAVGKQWIGFGLGTGPYRGYIYRTDTEELYRLTSRTTYATHMTHSNGELIAWQPGTGPDRGKTLVARIHLPSRHE